jgi:phospholipid/cholesterol/gamma-HCH transport system substrate-binding protein
MGEAMKTSTEMMGSLRRVALASRLFLAIAVVSVCAAVALLAWQQGAFTPTTRVFFYAGTAEGMHKGMAVKLVGFRVGHLDEIVIDNDLRVRVQIRLDRRYLHMIGADSTIRLAREGVIGANVLQVRPGSGDAGPVTRRSVLRYEREPSLEGAVTALVDQATPIVSDIRQLAGYFNNPDSDLRQALRNVNQTAATLNQAGTELRRLIAMTSDRVEKGERNVAATLDRARVLIDGAGSSLAVLDGSLRKIDAALPGITTKMDQSLENIRVASEAVRNMTTGELPGLAGEAQSLVSDTGEVVRGARQAWPVRNLVQPRRELLLRLDSGGGLSPAPADREP